MGSILMRAFSFALIICIGAFAAYGMVRGILKSAPALADLDTSPSASATTIYDAKGNEIQTLVMAGSNREIVKFAELPKDLINAFVAIEDERFWTHNGVDPRGIARALARGLMKGSLNAGASSIERRRGIQSRRSYFPKDSGTVSGC